MTESFTFDTIPDNSTQLEGMLQLSTPFETAALSVLVFCHYEKNAEETFEMIDRLKGPAPLSNFDKQFLNERLKGKEYKPFSFFEGATPSNNYTPDKPYRISVSDNPYSYTNEGYATVYLKSNGADSPRPITLRQKGDKWYLWQISFLSDIKLPAKDDAWS